MTEYDFSPEGYQRHLDNMARISRWVHRTEQHRPEFEDAAALVLDRHSRPRPPSPPLNKLKKRPQPLPLPPLGAPPYHPYPYPPNIPHSVGSNFDYGMGVGTGIGMDYLSPGGPMYAPMSAPIPPPGGAYPQLTLISPQHSHRSRSHSRRKSRSRSSSISYAAPPVISAPPGYYPYAPQGPLPSPMGYASPPPGFVVFPPSRSSSRHHGGPSFLYM